MVQHRHQLFQHRHLPHRFLVGAALGQLDVLGQRLLDHGQVGQRELGIDRLDIRYRIHLAGNMDHIGVFEAAHDVGDGIGFADIGEEFVAQPLTLGCARNQAGDIDKLHHRRQRPLRLYQRGKLPQSRIGHLDNADVGFDSAERIVLRRNAGLGQGVEQSGFTHIGETDDSALERHGLKPFAELVLNMKTEE